MGKLKDHYLRQEELRQEEPTPDVKAACAIAAMGARAHDDDPDVQARIEARIASGQMAGPPYNRGP